MNWLRKRIQTRTTQKLILNSILNFQTCKLSLYRGQSYCKIKVKTKLQHFQKCCIRDTLPKETTQLRLAMHYLLCFQQGSSTNCNSFSSCMNQRKKKHYQKRNSSLNAKQLIKRKKLRKQKLKKHQKLHLLIQLATIY